MSDTISCFELINVIINIDDRNIKCPTTERENQNCRFSLTPTFIETISKSCSGWSIHDSDKTNACNRPSIFDSLALLVVEMGRNRDHNFIDIFAQVICCCFSQSTKDHCRYLFRLKHPLLIEIIDAYNWSISWSSYHPDRLSHQVFLNWLICEFLSHETLSATYCVEWVSWWLLQGSISNYSFLIGESNTRCGYIEALIICYGLYNAIFPNCYTWVRGAKVYTNDSARSWLFSFLGQCWLRLFLLLHLHRLSRWWYKHRLRLLHVDCLTSWWGKYRLRLLHVHPLSRR